MKAQLLMISAIIIQFAAAFLAFRLVWITKRKTAWVFIAAAILLMAIRRCFTLYEWFVRDMSLMAVEISSELVGLATAILMLLGVAFIAPLIIEIIQAKDSLKGKVEEKTAELKASYQALQLELEERKRAEESLRKSEEKFRTFADFTYDWESWLAPDGSYIYVSPSCERISGYSADEFMKDPGLLEKITHPDDLGKVVKHLAKNNHHDRAQTLVFRIISRSGEERWVVHTCQPVFSPEGRHLGRRISDRDITHYKKNQGDKAKLEAQLRQSQKMEAIGTLAGGIAHDFNNILSPIIMYTEIALRDLPADNMLRPYLEQVLKSSVRASDLVKQILSISRLTERQRVMLQLSPLVKESLKLLRASLPASIEIRQKIDTQDDWTMADPTEIYQVVMNLCTNAAHAMEETGGVLTVGLDYTTIAQEQTNHGISVPPGKYLSLTVQDTGRGMSPEVLERIFEPYFTTKDIGQGTGLGLALVHGIVKNCRGGINAFSEPGKGTAFKVYFPVIESEQAAEPEPMVTIAVGKGRILVVDDEPDIVAALQIILERLGYQVTPFTDAAEALAAFRAGPEKFEVIITDLTMPHLSGLDLAREMLSLRPDLPIILCTGHSESITLEKARALGISDILLKPLFPAQLAESVSQLVDGGRDQSQTRRAG